MVSLFVDLQNDSANLPSLNNDTVRFAIRRVNASFNCFTRYDLAVKIKMIITFSKLFYCAVFERPLVIQNKLFSVI